MKTVYTLADRDDQEREADHFAMCLLIPEEALRERFPSPVRGSWSQHSPLITRLAKEFQVDELLMTKRLVQLELLL